MGVNHIVGIERGLPGTRGCKGTGFPRLIPAQSPKSLQQRLIVLQIDFSYTHRGLPDIIYEYIVAFHGDISSMWENILERKPDDFPAKNGILWRRCA